MAKKKQPPRNTSTPRRQSKNSTRRPKEVEINVDDSRVNVADLRSSNKRVPSSFDNDISWYSHYRAFLDNVSGVNYGSPIGSKIRYFAQDPVPSDSQYKWSQNRMYSAPGVMRIDVIPTLGPMLNDIESPVMRVAQQTYSAMRIKLGSRADYDPVDTMLYIGAMDSAFILYALAARAYGLLNISSVYNWYTQRALVEAMGLDWDSLVENKSQFRALINQYAIAIGKYMVPGDMDIFKRHVWMMQNLFTDSDTAKAQVYAYRMTHIYVLNEVQSGDKSLNLTHIPTNDNDLTGYGEFANIMRDVLSSLDTSQDISQMSADIGKAWGGLTVTASLIPEDYRTPIGYSKEVLSQIENCVLVGNIVTSGPANADITVVNDFSDTNGPRLRQELWTKPDSSGITSSDAVSYNMLCQLYLKANGFLNFHWQDVSNDDTIIASRGIPTFIRMGKLGSETMESIQLDSYGTEVYTFAHMYWLAGSSLQENVLSTNLYIPNSVKRNSIANISAFDWAPAINLLTYEGGTLKDYTCQRIQDIDVYGVVSPQQLRDMNYCCILSEFYSSVFVEKAD